MSHEGLGGKAQTRRRDRRGTRRRRAVYVLLTLPFAALLAVPLYAREEPALLGWPFFYWYQFAVAAVTIALMAVVYRVTRSHDRDDAPEPWERVDGER